MRQASNNFLDRLAARRRERLGWARAFAVVVLCAFCAELLAPHAALQDVIMVYLAGVAYVALHEGLRTSVATVLASILLFDLLIVPPRWGLNPLHTSHLLTLAVMLAVGLLISTLSSRAQQQAALAERRALRAQAMSDLAAQLASARSHAEVERTVSAASLAMLGSGCRMDLDGRLLLDQAGRLLTDEERELFRGFEHQGRLAVERCVFEQRSTEATVAAERERLRNTLLSGLSHDFRTPLTTIVGAATTLQEQGARLDDRMRQTLVSSIHTEARRLHERMSHLLDLTRMEEGAVQVSPEWCPADDLVAEVLLSFGDRLGRHVVDVDAAPDAVVWCDARLVEQALSNMVDNALRCTPAGGVIRIRVKTQETQWWLSVSDTGPGLPPGATEDVFRKFYRGQAEPAGTGFGLGLAICAAVARLHGGSIAAHNEGGAVFTMRLPQPQRLPLEEG
ncbi:sensor histidine kinase [Caenimonas sedimenti]|nr:ATP-binding protein [Caenimonas sedimenti]